MPAVVSAPLDELLPHVFRRPSRRDVRLFTLPSAGEAFMATDRRRREADRSHRDWGGGQASLDASVAIEVREVGALAARRLSRWRGAADSSLQTFPCTCTPATASTTMRPRSPRAVPPRRQKSRTGVSISEAWPSVEKGEGGRESCA